MQLEHPSVKTIEEAENPAAGRVQYGSLIGLLGLLASYFLIEHRGNGVAWTWMEIYSVIPAMLFLGATLSGGLTRPVRNRLIFGADPSWNPICSEPMCQTNPFNSCSCCCPATWTAGGRN